MVETITLTSGSPALSDKLLVSPFQNSFVKEIFRSLRLKIELDMRNVQDKSLIVTGLEPGCGKSTVAANISIALAQKNLRTLLVDGDMKLGSQHLLFGLGQAPGLSTYLCATTPLNERDVSALIRPTVIPNLSVITAGEYIDNSAELVASERFGFLKRFVATRFDYLIFDTPPLGAVSTSIVVHELFSRYIVVVKAGLTNIANLEKKIDEFTVLKKKLLGLVLNHAEVDAKLSYYSKYAKHYS